MPARFARRLRRKIFLIFVSIFLCLGSQFLVIFLRIFVILGSEFSYSAFSYRVSAVYLKYMYVDPLVGCTSQDPLKKLLDKKLRL